MKILYKNFHYYYINLKKLKDNKMIKINKYSRNFVAKNDFVTKSELIYTVKLFGIRLWESNSSQDTEVEENDSKKNVGFGK